MKATKKSANRRRTSIVPRASIERRIYFVRGEKVMIDKDLAILYRVTTGTFNQAVRRNMARFPPISCFNLLAMKPKT